MTSATARATIVLWYCFIRLSPSRRRAGLHSNRPRFRCCSGCFDALFDKSLLTSRAIFGAIVIPHLQLRVSQVKPTSTKTSCLAKVVPFFGVDKVCPPFFHRINLSLSSVSALLLAKLNHKRVIFLDLDPIGSSNHFLVTFNCFGLAAASMTWAIVVVVQVPTEVAHPTDNHSTPSLFCPLRAVSAARMATEAQRANTSQP